MEDCDVCDRTVSTPLRSQPESSYGFNPVAMWSVSVTDESEIRTTFSHVGEIQSDDLRRQVCDVWESAIDATETELSTLRWWPPLEAELDGPQVMNVEHVNAVTELSIGITDSLSSTVTEDIDRDLTIAGALLHDCSKLYELDGSTTTSLQETVPHPHYGVHLLAAAGCSQKLQHIVLAHSGQSAVEPRTIEAKIVALADQLAVDGLFWDRNQTVQ